MSLKKALIFAKKKKKHSIPTYLPTKLPAYLSIYCQLIYCQHTKSHKYWLLLQKVCHLLHNVLLLFSLQLNLNTRKRMSSLWSQADSFSDWSKHEPLKHCSLKGMQYYSASKVSLVSPSIIHTKHWMHDALDRQKHCIVIMYTEGNVALSILHGWNPQRKMHSLLYACRAWITDMYVLRLIKNSNTYFSAFEFNSLNIEQFSCM